MQFSKMEESKFGVFFHAGSEFAFRYSSELEGTIVGVNVVAIAALIYLSRYVDQRNKRIQHAAEAAQEVR